MSNPPLPSLRPHPTATPAGPLYAERALAGGQRPDRGRGDLLLVRGAGRENPELLLNTVRVTRNEHEECLVETSVNSTRVSLRLRQVEPLDALLVRKFARFLAQRAEAFGVLRREPLPGYDVSFLITGAQSGGGGRAEALTAFIVRFLEDFDREMNLLKLSVNTRGRAVARAFLESFG